MFDGEVETAGGAMGIAPAYLMRPKEVLRHGRDMASMEARIAWERYNTAAVLHWQLVKPNVGTEAELRVLDPFVQCAARVAVAFEITQRSAELLVNRGVALRDRLPAVNALLKAGRVAAHHIPDIVSRTELVEGSAFMADIDREIAETLLRRGSWSKKRMRDMVDATIFRRDPDLVRNNRKDALDSRGVWGTAAEHGMATLDAHGTAEEVAMIMARLEKLAMATCKADPRKKSDRMVDALFATVMGREFRCECPDDPKYPCTAEIVTVPADQVVSGVDVKIVLHVITDQATLDGTADNPGYLDGHGVISGDHVRDIADRPEVIKRPMGNKVKPDEADPAETGPAEIAFTEVEPAPMKRPSGSKSKGNRKTRRARKKAKRATERKKLFMAAPPVPDLGDVSDVPPDRQPPFVEVIPLPATQPGDDYRPSAVLDSYLRVRDLYCMWPGCDKKAWGADLDHTREYNHDDPDSGGHTHPSEMKTLCRFHHLLKTHSDWLDEQYPDPSSSRPRLIVTTPEGSKYDGPAWTGDDLFPTLRLIVFDNKRGSPPNAPPQQKPRTQPRTAAKHARRERERLINRRQRELDAAHIEALIEERARNDPRPDF